MLTPKTEMYSCFYIVGVRLGLPSIKEFETYDLEHSLVSWFLQKPELFEFAFQIWIRFSLAHRSHWIKATFNIFFWWILIILHQKLLQRKKKIPVPKLRGTHFDQRHFSNIQKRRFKRVLIHGVLLLHSPGLFYTNVSEPLICSWLWFMFWYGANEPVEYSKYLGSPVKC